MLWLCFFGKAKNMIHQYKLNGYNIVLDVFSGAVHLVDDVSYDVIEMFEEKSRDEIKAVILEKYKAETGDETKTIIASTASPYKFPRAVLKAISGENEPDDFEAARKIEAASGLKMPKQLSELSEKEPRFTGVCKREEMADFVLSTVGGDC